MARGGNQQTADTISSRSGVRGEAEDVLYGDVDARQQQVGVRQRQALQDLEAAYTDLSPEAEKIETAREHLRRQIDAVETATDRFADRWNDHADKISAFVDTVAINLSKDFFDFADHKKSCKREPCTCGYQAAREYAARVHKISTGEEAPDAEAS